jgi:two-component system alkaline phosphatase synthesis response regulator PhoP
MKKSIVIIEDEEHIANAEKLILSEMFNANIHVAKDGEEGFTFVKKLKPMLVILDLMLPGMSGFDVCKRIREDSHVKDTKIIMVTAKNQQIDEMKGMETGADDYIMKPFEVDELKHVITQVLNS